MSTKSELHEVHAALRNFEEAVTEKSSMKLTGKVARQQAVDRAREKVMEAIRALVAEATARGKAKAAAEAEAKGG